MWSHRCKLFGFRLPGQKPRSGYVVSCRDNGVPGVLIQMKIGTERGGYAGAEGRGSRGDVWGLTGSLPLGTVAFSGGTLAGTGLCMSVFLLFPLMVHIHHLAAELLLPLLHLIDLFGG